MPQKLDAKPTGVLLLGDLSKQVEDLRVLLDKVAPLIITIRGTYETILPLLQTLTWFQDKWVSIVDFLQKDLPDTKEMQSMVINYLNELDKYSTDIKSFVIKLKTSMEKDIMPKPSALISGVPGAPSQDPVNKLISQQKTFVGAAIAFGIFAVPSTRFAIEHALSKVKDMNNTLARSLTADAITIAGFTSLIGFIGRFAINQNYKDGAQLGLKLSFILVLVYEAARLSKYTLKESGASKFLPESIRKKL